MAWELPFELPGFEFGLGAAAAVDGTHVTVIFSEDVVVIEATNPANYVITGGAGLTVISVAQESSSTFVLTTSPQISGANYLLTASNIHDLNGDLI